MRVARTTFSSAIMKLGNSGEIATGSKAATVLFRRAVRDVAVQYESQKRQGYQAERYRSLAPNPKRDTAS